MTAETKSSVIIPVCNRAGLTRQCLDALLADTPAEGGREIVVVDDASTDSTSAVLAGYGDAIRVVRHERNAGFATSCNDGARAAEGEYLVFLNNDTLPLKGWLDALVRYADRHPKAGVVGCKLLFPDNTVQHAGVVITEDQNPRHLYAGFPSDHPAVNKSRRFPIVTAGCALFRRGPFEEAEGFDDAFVNGFEDVDLCLRLGELGYEVHYCHESVVYHLEKASRDEQDHPANHLLYRRRWAHKVRANAMDYYLEDGLVEIRFAERFPFFLKVSPELALIDEETREREADHLLAARARQVLELSRENVLLRLELAEAGISQPALLDHLAPPPPEHQPKAVYFVSDTPGDPMRYRCDHHAEELELLGATAKVSRLDQADLGNSFGSTACYVLHRVPASEDIEWVIRTARELGKVVLFDIDDLVFESRAAGSTIDLMEMPGIEKQVLAERLERNSRAMAMCDAVLVTTDPLADLAREVNRRVLVIPNAASKAMVELADEALAVQTSREQRREGMTIAYLSGSPTHDRDFLQAAEAVLWALDQDSTCRFLVVGNLSLDARFDRYADRITTLPIQPWQRLPAILAKVDVSLAPLEPDNPFTESKSCLKYIEAGLTAVPTIASPRADFVRAIEHGRNGFLAERPEEWREALAKLIESLELRVRVGRAAYDDVRARHTTTAVAPRLFEAIAGLMRDKLVERSLTVHWVGSSESLSEDRADDLARLIGHLRARKHTVRVFVNGGEVPSTGSRLAGDVTIETLPEDPGGMLADVVVALDPRAASVVAERSDALFKLLYVGPGNDGLGSSEAEFRHALSLPLRPVAVGEQLTSHLSSLRGIDVDRLDLPLDPAQFEEMLLSECFVRAASLTNGESESV